MAPDTVFARKTTVPEPSFFEKLGDAVPGGVSTALADRTVYARDYWPIALRWHLEGKVPALPDCFVWPANTAQVAAVIALARAYRVPVIPYGGGSGVMGGTVPLAGGAVVDVKRMDRVDTVDPENLTVCAGAGVNGMTLERFLNRNGYTLGHIPQSLYCSCLGGWLACRAAGQFSTKYGKIEDIVVALEAVLADGTVIRSKAVPRTATGPQVERLLLGSEGTLGIITEATLRVWPLPERRTLASYAFEGIGPALTAVRGILQAGVYPAVVRIYDRNETLRHFYAYPESRERCLLVLLMEGAAELVDVEERVARTHCEREGGTFCGSAPVEHWLETRFNVKESSEFVPKGFVFDTVEVACGWRGAENLYTHVIDAMRTVDGVVVASGHASHFYPQGVCFYFTFGGVPPKKVAPYDFYRAVWGAIMETCIADGGTISHHHGIGITRGTWLPAELQNRFAVLRTVKRALDPDGIMNPGKLTGEDDDEKR
jgi:alkyldihydroxyacetonephosphate synthase